jgi:protein-S-isoprenylcysteine O-methyltransferase Ste14
MGDTYSNESIGGLLRGILMDLRQLMREEIALARVEIREQAGRAKAAALALGAAAGALAFGVIFLLIALAQGIADMFDWPIWAGFFVVALLLGVTGAALLSSGRRQLRRVHAVPEQTVETVKENSEWIAKRLSSERR